MRWKVAVAIGMVTLLIATMMSGPAPPKDPLALVRSRAITSNEDYYEEHYPDGVVQFVRVVSLDIDGMAREDFEKIVGTDQIGYILDGAQCIYSASSGDLSVTYDSLYSPTLTARQVLKPREVLWVRMANLGSDPFEHRTPRLFSTTSQFFPSSFVPKPPPVGASAKKK